MDGPAGQPTDNPPNPDGVGVYHRTIPKLTVWVCWQPGWPIWQRFRLDPDPDPKWCSRTVANTNRVSMEMHLEAAIVRSRRYTWRPWSSEHRDALRGCDRASFEMYLQSIIERDWRSTWRWSSWTRSIWRRSRGAVPGAETLFISYLTHNRGNVTRWCYLWSSYGELAGDGQSVGRHAGSWSYIQGSTCNCENEGTTDNLTCMLYSVYAALCIMLYSVNSALRLILDSALSHDHGMER